jgi:hypothetical protein
MAALLPNDTSLAALLPDPTSLMAALLPDPTSLMAALLPDDTSLTALLADPTSLAALLPDPTSLVDLRSSIYTNALAGICVLQDIIDMNFGLDFGIPLSVVERCARNDAANQVANR